MKPALQTRRNSGGTIREVEQGLWRLEIPAGGKEAYRWAQLDDYHNRSRRDFPWAPNHSSQPLRLELRARVSDANLPGTWGFGFWNDPFGASFGVAGTSTRLPALPNAAWFFYAGPPNYLAFQDNHPAQGFLAATFSSPRIPSLFLAPGALALPLLPFRPAARLLRRLASRMINENAALVTANPTEWHTYRLDWSQPQVQFFVDGKQIFETFYSPFGTLGLVLWIDNQYVAFPPSGKFQMGLSPNPQAWLELADIQLTP